jgi:prevent-host-death family protein
MAVGVRELKQHLSEYLRRVVAGETVMVTDRGVPVAMLVPVTAEDALARGVEEGWIRPPRQARSVGHGTRATASRRVLDVLHEDRRSPELERRASAISMPWRS